MKTARFRPGWKLSLFTLLLLPVLVSLGFWQLAREEEKLALQAVYEARQTLDPVALESLDTGGDLQYMPVSLRGRYDNERVFLLDNRVVDGRAGYEALSAFQTTSGRTVLVNRGWLAPGRDRADLPRVPPVEGEVRISGQVYVPVGEQMMLGEESAFSGWPRVVQTLDTDRMLSELGARAGFPYTVRLAEGAPGALSRHWPVITTAPEKHRAYAVQWFAMAAALAGLFLYAGWRRPESHE